MAASPDATRGRSRSRSPNVHVKREPEEGRDEGRRRESPDRRRHRDSRSPPRRDDRDRRRSWSRSRSPRGRSSPRHHRRRSRSQSPRRSQSPPRRRSRWDRDWEDDGKDNGRAHPRGDHMRNTFAKPGVKQERSRRPDEIRETIPCAGFEGRIVGKGGETIKRLQRETGARIKVDRDKGECVVSGSAEQVVLGAIAVRDAMSSSAGGGGGGKGDHNRNPSQNPEAEATIHVAGFEGKIIGKGGETIKKTQRETGARINVDSNGGVCTVSGSKLQVEKACDAINALMESDSGEIKKVKREDDGDDGGGEYGPRGGGVNNLDDANLETLPPPVEPDFGLSGALAKETNTVNGVVLVYTEPMDKAPPPKEKKYRLYVFKDGTLLRDTEPLRISSQSYYLFGRDRAVADIPTDHPSCSKQHAVLQYRQKTKYDDHLGLEVMKSVPYLMCLEARNGTFINGEKLQPKRYYQLLEKDCVKFGTSSREYVLLAEDAGRR